jgi:hypothetical protein
MHVVKDAGSKLVADVPGDLNTKISNVGQNTEVYIHIREHSNT